MPPRSRRSRRRQQDSPPILAEHNVEATLASDATTPTEEISGLRTNDSENVEGGGAGGGSVSGVNFDSELASILRFASPSQLLPGGKDVGLDKVDDAEEEEEIASHVVIWGTDLNVVDSEQRFIDFLQSFKLDEDDDLAESGAGDTPHYVKLLEDIVIVEGTILDVDCAHIGKYDDGLLRQLISYPQDIIPTFDLAVNKLVVKKFRSLIGSSSNYSSNVIHIRPFNSPNRKAMRALDPEDIDQLVTVSGMVTRLSPILPEMHTAFFACAVCQSTTTVNLDRGRIAEPNICTHCNTSYSFTLMHNRSTFSDNQIVKIQESPDDMPAGQTPQTILICIHNDLVDTTQPGDRTEITGIYRAVSKRVNPRLRTIKTIYNTYIDALHFKFLNASSERLNSQRMPNLGEEQLRTNISKRNVDRILELSKQPGIYELLAYSVAPNIFENEDVKKGVLLQLFGGTRKTMKEHGRSHFRSEINILLCGDPGTSKSQLMQYVFKLVPRSQYTSGKGSSAVGLTAYITKDVETGQHVLQTGALVLADNGVCCIDEFDKMSDSARAILHEVMEQQTLSLAKAGIICQLNARTSVLAAANPVESEWNRRKTIIENIQLPHTLLSRFDLIFLILDPQQEQYDRRLASHLISLYLSDSDRTSLALQSEKEYLEPDVLREYITYARENIHPRLTDGASNALVRAYVEMRQAGSNTRGQVGAYPRQLESLIRLSEAHAKVRLSKTVEEADVAEARRLHREALKQSSVDPRTGEIDVNILATGASATDRKRRADLAQAIRNIIAARTTGQGGAVAARHGSVTTRKDALYQEIRQHTDQPIGKEDFEEALVELERSNVVVVTGQLVRLMMQ